VSSSHGVIPDTNVSNVPIGAHGFTDGNTVPIVYEGYHSPLALNARSPDISPLQPKSSAFVSSSHGVIPDTNVSNVPIGAHGFTDGNAVPIVYDSSDGVIPDTNVRGHGMPGVALEHEQTKFYGVLPNTRLTQNGYSVGATNSGHNSGHGVAVASRESGSNAVGDALRLVGNTSPHNQGRRDTVTAYGKPPLALNVRLRHTNPLQAEFSAFVNSLHVIENDVLWMDEILQQPRPSSYEDMSSESSISTDHGITRIHETTAL